MRGSGAFVISYREARGQALIIAVLAWFAVVLFVAVGRDDRSVFGPLKWTDFVHFYTLGDVARTRDSALLYDSRSLNARQSQLVPDSREDGFVAVYGPQTALLFAPFSRLPYVAAGACWALLTLVVYLTSLWLAWRPAREVLKDRAFIVAAALAFPPAWQLVIYGQTTAVVLAAFAGGLWALERNRHVLAGVALSLLLVKPQWGLIVAIVLLSRLEFRVISGIALGAALQLSAVVAVFGSAVLMEYGRALRELPLITRLLEPDAYKMHSLRAITDLLPGGIAPVVWVLLSIAIAWNAVRVWGDAAQPLRVRYGVMVLASALVNPHLSVYDVTVIVLPILWIGGWLQGEGREVTWFWQRCYWLTLATLVPTARLISVQLTPILLVELFLRIVIALRHSPKPRLVEAAL